MNQLKNKFILIVLSVFLFSISYAQKATDQVVISGTITNKGPYKQIYLDTLHGQNPWILVSAAIDENG